MGQGRTGRRGALFVIADRFTRDQGGTAPLVEGFYLLNLNRARRVSIPVRIWFGPPLDPETREEMERAPRWQIPEIGRASCRERVCHYVSISVVAVSLKKNN